jgi:hypothetical protein
MMQTECDKIKISNRTYTGTILFQHWYQKCSNRAKERGTEGYAAQTSSNRASSAVSSSRAGSAAEDDDDAEYRDSAAQTYITVEYMDRLIDSDTDMSLGALDQTLTYSSSYQMAPAPTAAATRSAFNQARSYSSPYPAPPSSSLTAPPPAANFGTSSPYGIVLPLVAASSRRSSASGANLRQIPPPPPATLSRYALTSGTSSRQALPPPLETAPHSLPTASKKHGLLAFGEDSDEEDGNATPSAAQKINSLPSFRKRQKPTADNQRYFSPQAGPSRTGSVVRAPSNAGPSRTASHNGTPSTNSPFTGARNNASSNAGPTPTGSVVGAPSNAGPSRTCGLGSGPASSPTHFCHPLSSIVYPHGHPDYPLHTPSTPSPIRRQDSSLSFTAGTAIASSSREAWQQSLMQRGAWSSDTRLPRTGGRGPENLLQRAYQAYEEMPLPSARHLSQRQPSRRNNGVPSAAMANDMLLARPQAAPRAPSTISDIQNARNIGVEEEDGEGH